MTHFRGAQLSVKTDWQPTGWLLEEAGEKPCSADNAELWFSDNKHDQMIAAQHCGLCRFRLECLQFAINNREPCGVWGGYVFDRGKYSVPELLRARRKE